MLKVVAGLSNCFAKAPKMAAIVSFVDLSNAKQTHINTRKVSTYVTCSAVIQDDAKIYSILTVILMPILNYPSQFVKLYHSLVGCALNMEDLPSNSPF